MDDLLYFTISPIVSPKSGNPRGISEGISLPKKNLGDAAAAAAAVCHPEITPKKGLQVIIYRLKISI